MTRSAIAGGVRGSSLRGAGPLSGWHAEVASAGRTQARGSLGAAEAGGQLWGGPGKPDATGASDQHPPSEGLAWGPAWGPQRPGRGWPPHVCVQASSGDPLPRGWDRQEPSDEVRDHRGPAQPGTAARCGSSGDSRRFLDAGARPVAPAPAVGERGRVSSGQTHQPLSPPAVQYLLSCTQHSLHRSPRFSQPWGPRASCCSPWGVPQTREVSGRNYVIQMVVHALPSRPGSHRCLSQCFV